ncbi:MAG: PorV/PorQ family protein [Cyclonatronaceae bacterium]
MKQLLFPCLVIMLLATVPRNADASGESTGLHFLLIGPSARNMGASDGHTASLTGPSAIYLNPALLSHEKNSSATLSYMLWPATDTQNSFAGLNYRSGRQAFGIALLSSLNDDIPFRRSPTNTPDGYFAVRYFSLAGSYARSIGPLALGVTGMYLHEQFFQQDASGYGFNAGATFHLLDERVRLGAAVRNLGSMADLAETATKLPSMFSFGTDIQLLQFSTSAIDDEIPLLLSVSSDYNMPLNMSSGSEDESLFAQDEGYINAGVELNISEIIDLRTGIRSGDTQRRFSFGVGLLVSDFYFNYAFLPFMNGFGVAHALSLQYQF